MVALAKYWLNLRIVCHNPGTWHNCSQVKLTSEESRQRTNCKTKYKLKNQNSLGNNRAASLGNNRATLTWEQSCQCHLGISVSVSLGSNCASFNWEQLSHCHFRTIATVSLEKNCASVTRLNSASFTWEQSCQFSLGTNLNWFKLFPFGKGNGKLYKIYNEFFTAKSKYINILHHK